MVLFLFYMIYLTDHISKVLGTYNQWTNNGWEWQAANTDKFFIY
jgi:hypothetical protein